MSRDCQLVIMGPFGRIDLSWVLHFDPSLCPNRTWAGSFDLERGGDAVDIFLSKFRDGETPPSTFYVYQSEPDGSTSTYQFDGAVFRFPVPPTNFDTSVRQSIEFTANRRRRI